ncbi:MAG TPA: NAD(P)(+) transhydrogenase (Re/Si-specific) subunit beta [Candidatus Kapabacteria bacterium]|nr:NAD(P)(+) transhydrogenase (Re/Si-specific) subunit beta [Candidatus Kapabacteria bacterium]
MINSFAAVSYIAAIALFILSLSGLSKHETARKGNLYGIIGMLLAVIATTMLVPSEGFPWLIGAMLPAILIGATLAMQVAMTSMPELIAMLHSFVGAAAVLVGVSSFLGAEHAHIGTSAEAKIHLIEVYIGVFIGAVTFTGSIVAFGKLNGKISGKPLMIPGRHILNIVLLLVAIYFGYEFVADPVNGMTPLLINTAIACILGVHLVMAIGGADMPVVVSMLNSYSGWAAAAAGFMLSNDLLIVTGALVGSSGAILSYIMCKAMNRSIVSVILGGFGADEGASPGTSTQIEGEVTPVQVGDVVEMLKDASKVIIIPGYGVAVAQAQHSLSEMVKLLRAKNVNVRFAIHPVAGRLPGHMNVLLAESNVPYDIVLEMDEINEDFPETDVALVIGANDIVNPSAEEDPTSPIAGMPVLQTWKAKVCIVMKRSMASGYAGVENPLFYKENTRMLFGDAKKNIDALVDKLRPSEIG